MMPLSPQTIGRSRMTGMKENDPDIPVTGMAVLHQQFLLVQAIEQWITTLKEKMQ